MDSPPLSLGSPPKLPSSPLSDQIDDLDICLATYVPLSNLPTPPLPREAPNKRRRLSVLEDLSFNTLDAPAVHLANLVPTNLAADHSSVIWIKAFLVTSQVSKETIGLAACILDSLSLRFARRWRDEFRPNQSCAASAEVIPLAAICLAHSFLSDSQMSPGAWFAEVSEGIFSPRVINRTIRSILLDIDYGLHSFTMEMIQESLEDIECARRWCCKTVDDSSLFTNDPSEHLLVLPGYESKGLPLPTTADRFAHDAQGLPTPAQTPPDEF